jgi:GTP cyclohydrolase II
MMPVIPTKTGNFRASCYVSKDGKEHFVAIYGEVVDSPLLRIHSECLTGDVFGSLRCDCGEQLALSMHMLSERGGIIIYLRQEGRGIGLNEKLKAYYLQDNEGYDTVDANINLGHPEDARTYEDALAILHSMSISSVKLITNNPSKIDFIEQGGIKVVEVVPCHTAPTVYNSLYLSTKQEKMGHNIQK